MKTYLLLFFMWVPALVGAQTTPSAGVVPGQEVFVRLKDGSTVRGKLISTQNNQIRLVAENLGELVLALDQVTEITEARGFTRNGQFWFDNPFYTNYFVSPTALTLRKGEAVFQNSYIFLNGINVGVTDALTLGGGLALIPGSGNQTVYFTPKICLNRNGRTKFGIGTATFVSFVREVRFTGGGFNPQTNREVRLGGVAYGTVTFGGEEKNGTLGAGWAYGDDLPFSSVPVLTASYFVRSGRKVGFITENWIVLASPNTESGAVLSGGVRLFGERIGGDLGLLVPVGLEIDRFIALPYASLKVKFGRKYNAD